MALALALVLWQPAPCCADGRRQAEEVHALKAHLERLEAQRPPDQDEGRPGFLKYVSASGFVVALGQGTAGNRPEDSNGATVAASLTLKAEPTPVGTVGLRLLMVRGLGITRSGIIPGLVLGTPNVIAEFNSNIPHLVEAWYEPSLFNEKVAATFGILDPTKYFDTNRYANDEETQFVGFPFVNNSGIDWGGDIDFYGPGVRAAVSPLECLSINLGGFATHTVSPVGKGEQNEIVGFDQEFNRPFAILEVSLKLSPSGREGTYRLYGWLNGNDRKAAVFHTDDHRASWGAGGSFDQVLAEGFGAFLRWSKQDQSVGPLNWHVSGGLSATGLIPSRPHDTAAVGYALGRLSAPYREAEGLAPNEQWLETYYSYRAGGHLFLSPDFQYIVNAAGRSTDILIWGFRAQAAF